MLRESRESQGGEPLSSQSDSWKLKNGDSEKQTFHVTHSSQRLWHQLKSYGAHGAKLEARSEAPGLQLHAVLQVTRALPSVTHDAELPDMR